jgi:hypothetical protein
MGKMKSAMRKLDPVRVQMAQKVQAAKHELAMKMVAERVKTDAEFAADVLKVAGDGLRPEIRKDAEETIARNNLRANMEFGGGIGNAIGLAQMDKEDAEKAKALTEKWDKTGLLDGLKEDLKPSEPSVLLESQQNHPIVPDEQCGGDGCLCQNH